MKIVLSFKTKNYTRTFSCLIEISLFCFVHMITKTYVINSNLFGLFLYLIFCRIEDCTHTYIHTENEEKCRREEQEKD